MRRERIFERDGHRCVYCGVELAAEALTLDHVQPRMKGGDRSRGNLVTACAPCNAAKAGRRLSEFLRERPDGGAYFRTHGLAKLWPRLGRSLLEELRTDEDRGKATDQD